jgi:hypothetical protein
MKSSWGDMSQFPAWLRGPKCEAFTSPVEGFKRAVSGAAWMPGSYYPGQGDTYEFEVPLRAAVLDRY